MPCQFSLFRHARVERRASKPKLSFSRKIAAPASGKSLLSLDNAQASGITYAASAELGINRDQRINDVPARCHPGQSISYFLGVRMAKKPVAQPATKAAAKKALSDASVDKTALAEITANGLAAGTSIDTMAAPARSYSPQTMAFSSGNSVGPTTASLKEKFSAQKIPLQTDFADLIDVANCGRDAMGLNPLQPGGTGAGLQLDADSRLAVVPGVGITIDATGVRLEETQMFAVGMIMMFSGQVAPAGWAFCDGSHGTPDLRNRFILGGASNESGATNGTMQQTMPLNDKQYHPAVSQQAPAINMNNAATVLTTAMLPQHYHNGGIRLDNWAYNWATEITEYGISGVGSKGCIVHVSTPTMQAATANTSSVGSNAPHSHANTATQVAHSHTVNIIPPYYILAFIIKV